MLFVSTIVLEQSGFFALYAEIRFEGVKTLTGGQSFREVQVDDDAGVHDDAGVRDGN